MFKKLNCRFRTGTVTTATINLNQISAIASTNDYPGWNYVYLKGDSGAFFLVTDEQRKEIEKQLQSNLELE